MHLNAKDIAARRTSTPLRGDRPSSPDSGMYVATAARRQAKGKERLDPGSQLMEADGMAAQAQSKHASRRSEARPLKIERPRSPDVAGPVASSSRVKGKQREEPQGPILSKTTLQGRNKVDSDDEMMTASEVMDATESVSVFAACMRRMLTSDLVNRLMMNSECGCSKAKRKLWLR